MGKRRLFFLLVVQVLAAVVVLVVFGAKALQLRAAAHGARMVDAGLIVPAHVAVVEVREPRSALPAGPAR